MYLKRGAQSAMAESLCLETEAPIVPERVPVRSVHQGPTVLGEITKRGPVPKSIRSRTSRVAVPISQASPPSQRKYLRAHRSRE